MLNRQKALPVEVLFVVQKMLPTRLLSVNDGNKRDNQTVNSQYTVPVSLTVSPRPHRAGVDVNIARTRIVSYATGT